MSNPTPQERAAADAVSRLGQEHPTELSAEVLAELYADYTALETEPSTSSRNPGGSTMSKPTNTKETNVSAAVQPDPGQCTIAGPDGTRIIHDEGHAWVHIGGPVWVKKCSSCHTIDRDDLAREVRKAQAKALRDAVESGAVHVYTAPQHNAPGVDAVVATDLEERADELERGDTDAR